MYLLLFGKKAFNERTFNWGYASNISTKCETSCKRYIQNIFLFLEMDSFCTMLGHNTCRHVFIIKWVLFPCLFYRYVLSEKCPTQIERVAISWGKKPTDCPFHFTGSYGKKKVFHSENGMLGNQKKKVYFCVSQIPST